MTSKRNANMFLRETFFLRRQSVHLKIKFTTKKHVDLRVEHQGTLLRTWISTIPTIVYSTNANNLLTTRLLNPGHIKTIPTVLISQTILSTRVTVVELNQRQCVVQVLLGTE